MRHKHKWTFSGIIYGNSHFAGMVHRTCKCSAELYEPPTEAERRKHDPHGEAPVIQSSRIRSK